MARHLRGSLSPPHSPLLPHIVRGKRRRSAGDANVQAPSTAADEGSLQVPDVTGLKRTDIGAPEYKELIARLRSQKGAEWLWIVLVEARDLEREMAAYIRVRRLGHVRQTLVSRKSRNPVWNHRGNCLREPGAVMNFELCDKDRVGGPVGYGELRLDDALLAQISERHPEPHEAWVELTLKGKPAGRLRLRFGVETGGKFDRLAHEFRDVSPAGNRDLVHYLEPGLRQLRVKLKRCVAATPARAQVYLVVQCGLFEAMSEWHFVDPVQPSDGDWVANAGQRSGLHKVDFHEDFIIGVPHRNLGCSPLPSELVWSNVELSLYIRDEQLPDELIGKVHVPFAEIAGYDGDAPHPSAPPWARYALPPPYKAKIKRTVKDACAKVADPALLRGGGKGAGDAVVEAALYFDTSYDKEVGPFLGTATLRFLDLHVPQLADYFGTFSVYIVFRCGKHWVRFSLPKGQTKVNVSRAFEFEVQEPRMVITIAVMARDETATSNVTENIASRLSRADRPLGVLHVRPTSVMPYVWSTSAFPLLTRGKGKCHRHGTLSLSVRWNMPLGLQLLRQYLKPPLPVQYYYEPWTAQQTNLFGQYTNAAIVLYLDKQPAPIKSDCSSMVLAHKFAKFDRALLKAHMKRMKNAAQVPMALGSAFNKVRYWENPVLSAAVNAVWVAFVHCPLEGLTALVAGWVVALVYKVCTCPMSQGLQQKDPELFGGVQEDVESDEEGKALQLPGNPVRVLQEKLERFENVGGRVQTIAHQVACAMESANGAFLMTDLVITAIFLAAAIALVAALWVLPFSLVLSGIGCWVLRHPRFRKKTPSKVLCLATRLPNKADEVISARAP